MICDRCFKPLSEGEHGQYLCPLEPRRAGVSVIDDSIEGGPRFFDTMGPEDVWIDSKSQWRREVAARNLEHVDKHDRDFYRRRFRQHDEELRDTGTVK